MATALGIKIEDSSLIFRKDDKDICVPFECVVHEHPILKQNF